MTPTLPAWLAQVKARVERAEQKITDFDPHSMPDPMRWVFKPEYQFLLAARQDVPALVKIVEAQARVIEALKRADGATYAADHSITLEAGIAARQYERDCSMAVQGADIALAAAIKEATDVYQD